MALDKEARVEHISHMLFALWQFSPDFSHVKNVEIIIEWADKENENLWDFQKIIFEWSDTEYENFKDYLDNLHTIMKKVKKL